MKIKVNGNVVELEKEITVKELLTVQNIEMPDYVTVQINEMNPDVNVVTYQEWVSSANIKDIIDDKGYDFIIDGTDNFPAKFLINDACVLLGKAFSHAGIIRFQGQTMTYVPGQGPCYRMRKLKLFR